LGTELFAAGRAGLHDLPVQHIIRQEVAVGREAGRRSRRARLEVSEIRRVGDSHREMFIFLANGAAESEL
jgi:hypothetical protein